MSSEPIACKLTAEQLRQGAGQLLPALVAEANAVAWFQCRPHDDDAGSQSR